MLFITLFLVNLIRTVIVLMLFLWIPLAIIISMAGKKRKIGFWISLVLCILFTPVVGFIAVILSDKK